MLNLKTNYELPFSARWRRTAEPRYEEYAELRLKPTLEQPERGKTYVESHWVGSATVWSSEETDLDWSQQGATPWESLPLPARLEELVLVRPGLPPMSFTAFAKLHPNLRPLWWEDWQSRSYSTTSSTPTSEPKPKVVAWDLGTAAENFPQQTSVTARNNAGEEGQIHFTWYHPTQTRFDIAFRARFEHGLNRSEEATEFIEAIVTKSRWLTYLAKAAWIQAVEPLPENFLHQSQRGIEKSSSPQKLLSQSYRIHLGLRANGQFVAKKFADLLTHLLSHYSEPNPAAPIKLLTQSYEISIFTENYVSSERDLRLWPAPTVVEEPLREMPVPDEAIMDRLAKIRAQLQSLREQDPHYSVFGASDHKYVLNSCLTERAVQNFENQFKVELPLEYRLFLMHVGNGKAGPGYGLEPLPLIPPHLSPNRLAQPFPLKEACLPEPDESGEELEAEVSQNAMTEGEPVEVDEFFEAPPDFSHFPGALRVSHYGCGIEIILILTGEERGHIWWDSLCNDAGVGPETHQNAELHSRMGFLDWYEDWLNQSLEKLST